MKDGVVVITGASSGIGRATALKFAESGAKVILAARRINMLNEVAEDCKQKGASDTFVVPTDVSKLEQVDDLLNKTIDRYGHIDVWFNNAGVYLFGEIDKTPDEVFRKVIEVNLFGVIYGSKAALSHFKQKGRGVLINMGSLDGKVGAPYGSAYVASKFGVVGLSESLRQELYLEGFKDIHVCTVLPSAIDTPLFQHAGNYVGKKIKALRPVFDPFNVAKTIVDLVENPQRETFIGWVGDTINISHKLAPEMTEKIMAKLVEKDHFQEESVGTTPGNVLEPVDDGLEIHGGWKNEGSHKNPNI